MSIAQNRVNRIVAQFAPLGQTQVAKNECAAFDHVEAVPPDAIFLTKQLYGKCSDPKKVNLGIGAYRTNEGKPYVLKCVQEAETRILQATKEGKLNKEYLGQGGDASFTKAAASLVFGADNPVLTSGHLASIQTLSGTGALRLAIDFFKKFGKGSPSLYYPNPTWGNHGAICKEAGVAVGKYRYWDPKTRGLDFAGMCEDIKNAPKDAIICLHACAHNPTGVDPTHEQWKAIADLVSQSGHFVLFDSAYQGFASGNLDYDAFPVRLFASRGIPFMLCQSFAKNIGLYNERIGCLHLLAASTSEASACFSNLKILVRRMFSNPPAHGARIVSTILNDKSLRTMWQEELTGMSNRIIDMRAALFGHLKALKTPGDWTHITSQIGMFSFTGLTPKQVENMINKHSVFMLKNGRISMAGVNPSNVEHIARGIDDSVRNH